MTMTSFASWHCCCRSGIWFNPNSYHSSGISVSQSGKLTCPKSCGSVYWIEKHSYTWVKRPTYVIHSKKKFKIKKIIKMKDIIIVTASTNSTNPSIFKLVYFEASALFILNFDKLKIVFRKPVCQKWKGVPMNVYHLNRWFNMLTISSYNK